MNARWQRYAKRIDAMSLRERAFLFLSAALVIIALADSLVLSPAVAEQQSLSAQLELQSKELKALRAQLFSASQQAQADTPEGKLQKAIAVTQSAQIAIDKQIRRHMSSPEEMARLPDLLERTLRRHDRLTLVKLATVAEPPLNANASISATATASLRWQGVDLSVAGGYLDLMNYLAELERSLPGLRWGELQIATTSAPPVLSVRLYLVGAAP